MTLEKRFSSLEKSEEGKVSGYALLWDTPSFISSIGKKERFKKGSLKLPKAGVPLYFQHDRKNLLANSKSNTLILKEDDRGLYFEASLPENAKLVRELCKRKDIQGASISFQARKQNYKEGTREIEDAVLSEISLVSAPAHKTSVSFRSKDQREKKHWSSLLWEY